MNSEQMFDQRTLNFLSAEHQGYVFNRVGCLNFENSFFIFNKENLNLCKIHNEAIIKQAALEIIDLRNVNHPSTTLGAQSIYNLYWPFLREIGEKGFSRNKPRKVVKCPKSQFNLGGNFSPSDYQSETFRFIGDSNVPYTRKGRSLVKGRKEKQIEALVDWKSEPLPSPESCASS